MPEAGAGAPQSSTAGLAACLLALASEAHALHRPLAAHLITAAAAAVLENDDLPVGSVTRAEHR